MTTTPRDPGVVSADVRPRLLLLIGQGVSMGLMLALVIIAGMTLILATYGSDVVPYVYIIVAVLGALLFYGYGELLRRRPLPTLSLLTLAFITLTLALTWAGLVWAGWPWLSIIVLVSFSLFIQVGFVVIGAQAGRLLDVRQIKRFFPWIVAGFVVGFMLGGALVTPLTRWTGRPEHMILAAAVAALIFGCLIALTSRRHGAELVQSSPSGRPLQAPPMRVLLTRPYVRLLFVYQMLSAVATYVIEFMLLVVVGARFTDSSVLARFFGNFVFALNFTDLVFVLLLAGILLSRFGLRFGLTANPGVVILLLAAMIVSGVVDGTAGALFFWLAVAVRIADVTMTDGTTRTSINAAYQALRAEERVGVQAGVEGIGVPVALGVTGLLLLGFQAWDGLTLVHLAGFALALSLVWAGAGVLVYRAYADGLLQTMRRRTLAPAGLTIEDGSTLAVVEQMLTSDQVADVRLALDMLADAEHPTLDRRLTQLAERAPNDVRVEALTRIADRNVAAAAPVVEALLESAEAEVRAAALQALCSLGAEDAVERAVTYLDAPDAIVRQRALVGLLLYGGLPGIVAAAGRLSDLERSPAAADRRMVAQVLGAVGNAQLYQPLIALLQEESLSVRRAALLAAVRVSHVRLLPLLIANLERPATRSAAVEALIAAGDMVLPALAAALDGTSPLERTTLRHLIHVCDQSRGVSAGRLFMRHLDHPDPEVRMHLLKALNSGARSEEVAPSQLLEALRREAGYAFALLVARSDLGGGEAVDLLARALDDALASTQQRVLLVLRLSYDARALTRAADLLTTGSGAEQAMALEMLDVTLAPDHRALAWPVIHPHLDETERQQQLGRFGSVPSLSRTERLRDLAVDPRGQWRQGWLRACAAYAIGHFGLDELTDELTQLLADPDVTVGETAAWALDRLQASSASSP